MMSRPRATGISAAARPQQLPAQTFKPKSEWKHEEEASFLFVYLPGFAVGQLTIAPDHSNRRVKVEGKRWLPHNRSLTVNETFSIPEDCDLSKMGEQFGRGILMLKMPRNITAQLVPQQQTETTEETKKETSNSMAQNDEDQTDPSKGTAATGKLSATTTMDEKSTAITAANTSDAEQKLVEKKDQENDANGKPDKPGSPEILERNAGVKEEESKEQSKESAMGVAEVEGKEKEKSLKGGDAERKEAEKENAKVSSKKDTVKEGNEERKLIMNMGSAFLIIVGLGVCLFYTLGHKLAR